ncbi:MAG: hypothetical protein HQ546_07215 [Planctomycetes bacterium]|nr:hypothetical protein [Planctomycetota bacterium]
MQKDSPRQGGRGKAHLWRPAILAWGGVNLAALCVGLFPRLLLAESAAPTGPLPALQALAIGQVGFALLIYPLILACRMQHRRCAEDIVEACLWMLMSLPFFAVAGYFADATAQDVVRVAVLTASMLFAGWGLADLAGWGSAGVSVSVLISVLIVLGGPMANYLAWAFWQELPPMWLWQGCPMTFASSVAAVRQDAWIPGPLWAWLLWPALAVTFVLVREGLGRGIRAKTKKG